MSNKKVGHIVIVFNPEPTCVGIYYSFEKALDYAWKEMIEHCVAEEVESVDIDADDNQYTMLLTHDEIDFKIAIDYAPVRDCTITEEK